LQFQQFVSELYRVNPKPLDSLAQDASLSTWAT
jgi:hypothetical protein